MYGKTFWRHNSSAFNWNEALLIYILVDQDTLQNAPNIESLQYCNRKLLNVFEGSAQHVRTVVSHSAIAMIMMRVGGYYHYTIIDVLMHRPCPNHIYS